MAGRPKKYDLSKPNPFDVKPGQVWESLDARYLGVAFQVHQVRIDYGYANVWMINQKRYRRIKLTRFVPRRNGYKLIK